MKFKYEKYASLSTVICCAVDLSAALYGFGAYADEVTLCKLHEEVYLSCQSEGKIISLCASGNISPNNGYVQYRFGTTDHIALEFPKKRFPPMHHFRISDISEGSLSFTHVKFRSGNYDYVLYQGFPSGVYIKKSGKLVSNLLCEKGDYQTISPRAFRGIETVAPVDGIDN
jgi:hypothetical protein